MILYAIPTPLGGPAHPALPVSTLETVRSLRDFAVENAKSARAFLSQVGMPLSMRELHIEEIGERPGASFLQPLREGRPLGLLSEAGSPAIADPGAALVEVAHREGFRVVPLIGPSSIVLALMASGLEGQRFAFCGYLPREAPERARRIRALESRSLAERETEICIETPYRSDVLLGALIESCKPATRLCVAVDLTLPNETIHTRSIQEWKMLKSAIGRRPAVFLLLADGRG